MPCPRCDGSLTTYQLDSHREDVCEDCGFVGITRVYEPDSDEPDSWEQAQPRGNPDEKVVIHRNDPTVSEPTSDEHGGPTVTRRRG